MALGNDKIKHLLESLDDDFRQALINSNSSKQAGEQAILESLSMWDRFPKYQKSNNYCQSSIYKLTKERLVGSSILHKQYEEYDEYAFVYLSKNNDGKWWSGVVNLDENGYATFDGCLHLERHFDDALGHFLSDLRGMLKECVTYEETLTAKDLGDVHYTSFLRELGHIQDQDQGYHKAERNRLIVTEGKFKQQAFNKKSTPTPMPSDEEYLTSLLEHMVRSFVYSEVRDNGFSPENLEKNFSKWIDGIGLESHLNVFRAMQRSYSQKEGGLLKTGLLEAVQEFKKNFSICVSDSDPLWHYLSCEISEFLFLPREFDWSAVPSLKEIFDQEVEDISEVYANTFDQYKKYFDRVRDKKLILRTVLPQDQKSAEIPVIALGRACFKTEPDMALLGKFLSLSPEKQEKLDIYLLENGQKCAIQFLSEVMDRKKSKIQNHLGVFLDVQELCLVAKTINEVQARLRKSIMQEIAGNVMEIIKSDRVIGVKKDQKRLQKIKEEVALQVKLYGVFKGRFDKMIDQMKERFSYDCKLMAHLDELSQATSDAASFKYNDPYRAFKDIYWNKGSGMSFTYSTKGGWKIK